MTPAYLRQATEFLATQGFSVAVEHKDLGQIDGKPCPSVLYTVTRGADEHLVFQLVEHPKEGERYFLEIVAFHGLRSFSFPLDSWKFKKTALELKYYALPDSGLGLSLTLEAAPAVIAKVQPEARP